MILNDAGYIAQQYSKSLSTSATGCIIMLNHLHDILIYASTRRGIAYRKNSGNCFSISEDIGYEIVKDGNKLSIDNLQSGKEPSEKVS